MRNRSWRHKTQSTVRLTCFRLYLQTRTRKTVYVQLVFSPGGFENEALENEDRSTKHPNLENEAPKTRKRSIQISKTKHPKRENGAFKSRKRSTQNSKTKHPNLKTTVRWRTTTVSCKSTVTFSFEIDAPNIISCAPKIFSWAPKISTVRLKIYIW